MKQIIPPTPLHLGGHKYITHTDHGVLRWCRDKLNIHSMIDIGCGPGGQVRAAREEGYEWAIGIDGDPAVQDPGLMNQHDFTTGPVFLFGNYQLAWCVEFLEHVEDQYIDNVFSAFSMSDYAVVTAAPPGKGGFHHVNCRSWEWWKNVFYRSGWTENEALGEQMRAHSTMLAEGEARGVNPRDFVRQRGHFMQRMRDSIYD